MTMTRKEKEKFLPDATRADLELRSVELGLDSMEDEKTSDGDTTNPDTETIEEPPATVEAPAQETKAPEPAPVQEDVVQPPIAQQSDLAELLKRVELSEQRAAIAEQRASADRGRLKNENLLNQKFELMEQRMKELQEKPKPITPTVTPKGPALMEELGWTQDQFDEYGEDTAISAYVSQQQARQEIERVIAKSQNQQQEQLEKQASAQFFTGLNSSVPDWESIRDHPQWDAFLATTHQDAFMTYEEVLFNAKDRGDHDTGARLFELFKRLVSPQNGTPTPAQTEAPAPVPAAAVHEMPAQTGGDNAATSEQTIDMTLEEYSNEVEKLQNSNLNYAELQEKKDKITARARASGLRVR